MRASDGHTYGLTLEVGDSPADNRIVWDLGLGEDVFATCQLERINPYDYVGRSGNEQFCQGTVHTVRVNNARMHLFWKSASGFTADGEISKSGG